MNMADTKVDPAARLDAALDHARAAQETARDAALKGSGGSPETGPGGPGTVTARPAPQSSGR